MSQSKVISNTKNNRLLYNEISQYPFIVSLAVGLFLYMCIHLDQSNISYTG